MLHTVSPQGRSFQLREDGYGDFDHDLPPSGWKYRRMKVAYEREFAAHTGLRLTVGDWTVTERQRLEELVQMKYGQSSWNQKR